MSEVEEDFSGMAISERTSQKRSKSRADIENDILDVEA